MYFEFQNHISKTQEIKYIHENTTYELNDNKLHIFSSRLYFKAV
jgi:hypothetical protein